MCFSATASFTASVVIGIAGVVTLRVCKTPAQKFLGSVPVLFALQQVAEGFVWLSFNDRSFAPYQHLFTLCFLFLAWVVWPVLVPLSFYKLEPDPVRKKRCKWLICLGVLSASYAIFNMAAKHPVPTIATFHIIYKSTRIYHHDLFFIPHQAAYMLATVLPMFISSLKGAKLLAIANFAALAICFWFFQYALPSTWCFFAAFLSCIIYWIIRKHNNSKDHSADKAVLEV